VSSTLLVIALVASFVNIFGPGALAAWGLGGGDGEPRNVGARVLAVLVVAGLLLTPAIAIRALADDTPSWWWLSLLPAVAWLVGALVLERPSSRDLAFRIIPLTAVLAIPAIAIGMA
jgi:hypothetical protein